MIYKVKNGELEHRKVVEAKIKRKLKSSEVIHHIDKNKKNNKIENLMIFSTQGKHMSFHNKIQQFGITNNINLQLKNRWSEYEKET